MAIEDAPISQGLIAAVQADGRIRIGWKARGKSVTSILTLDQLTKMIPVIIRLASLAAIQSGWERGGKLGESAPTEAMILSAFMLADNGTPGCTRTCLEIGPTELVVDVPNELAQQMGLALAAASASGAPS